MTLQELKNQLKSALEKLNLDSSHVSLPLVNSVAEELDADYPNWQRQDCLTGEQISYVFNKLIPF